MNEWSVNKINYLKGEMIIKKGNEIKKLKYITIDNKWKVWVYFEQEIKTINDVEKFLVENYVIKQLNKNGLLVF